ncbi:MAG: UDP-3-O-acyl-N-acetylglucosamine deacetylase [Alphaproteobacteria bacterium]|nr:UDP-3-O-acyl-N-acetylglucosamine deacetylase [Alphaproteobacteria bacterium]
MFAGSKNAVEIGRKAGAANSMAMRQHTLKTAINCTGVGLHSGTKISMTLHPAEDGTGIVFRRVDIAGAGSVIPAHWSHVVDTRMCTVIGNDAKVTIGTIEHLMAAFAGMGVDNAIVEINGGEIPVMDGSAAPFVFLMECAGITEQDAPRRAIKILKKVSVRDGDKTATLYPASDGFAVDFGIAFAAAAVAHQSYTFSFSGPAFAAEISRARTFGFLEEVAQLQAAGLARGGSLDNAVVVSGDRILNEEGLRFDDEFVRHKILDAVGDLYLAGHPMIGRFQAHCSGHAINNRLLRQLFADPTAWTIVDDVAANESLSSWRIVPRRAMA